jgi:tetratricopeptide (TPR) repeat protein
MGARVASLAFITLTGWATTSTMAVDLSSLWDFSKPELSEQRFRAALASASGDDALVLHTQIARSYGLRRDFDKARQVLMAIEPQIASAGAEARVRYQLELGRTHASATHAAEQQTAESKALARSAYQQALDEARRAKLDGLAIDAIHMLAFVDTAPADQLKWGQQALAVVESSTQPDARRWEASIRNNIGYALHQLGRYDEALEQFRVAVLLREQGSNAQAARAAHWMVAWTLRAMGRGDEALPIQLRLEREADAAGTPDPHVFEELERLYRDRNDEPRADHYRQRREALNARSPGG